jgi:hypothetical protein
MGIKAFTSHEELIKPQQKNWTPWIGVDLDATLAVHPNSLVTITFVGEPIMPMVERIKFWLKQGIEVRICTARWCDVANRHITKTVIDEFCIKHIGQALPITNEKDYGMLQLWDDRAIQVERNTGKRADGKA